MNGGAWMQTYCEFPVVILITLGEKSYVSFWGAPVLADLEQHVLSRRSIWNCNEDLQGFKESIKSISFKLGNNVKYTPCQKGYNCNVQQFCTGNYVVGIGNVKSFSKVLKLKKNITCSNKSKLIILIY